jgi:predicted lipid-binding transport protein (Tim44 family)
MTRCCVALLVLIACAAPSAALAQQQQPGGGSNPFGPLPQPPPPAPDEPEPQPADFDEDEDGLGGTAFWLIIGTTGAIFAVIAFFIVRDMRRTVGKPKKRRRLRGTRRPAADAAQALAQGGRHEPGSHKARAKAQQRAKTKAARKQRRKSRSR